LHTQYTFISPDLPSDDWRSLQLAGRISGTIKNFDVAMSYYYGYNKFPFFDKSLHHLSQDTMYLNIQKRYSRIQSVGGDFATVVADFGMHGEIAYYITEDIDDGALADGPFLRFIVGLDRTIFNVIGDNNIFIIFEWIHEYSFTGQEFYSTDIKHLFQNALFSRLQLDIGAFANLYIQGVYNIDTQDLYIQPKFDYKIADGLTLEALIDVLNGKTSTFFGNYNDNSRFQFKLKYNF
ncbi:MAG: hypothetical protein R6V16_05070, partial [Bacteroidales bacterium]